jgi:hypothetical protein
MSGPPVGRPEKLSSAHVLVDFDSGQPTLDDWLRRRAHRERMSCAPVCR